MSDAAVGSDRPLLVYVAATLPFGAGDVFFAPEVLTLERRGVDVAVVPARPRGKPSVPELLSRTWHHPLVDGAIALGALRTACRHPVRTARAVWTAMGDLRPRVLVRNLVVVPKALWLAGEAERRGASHIHAHWAGPPSTLAMLAAEVSGVPWSMTAHSFDISANNLLARKLTSARFARFIGGQMMELARDVVPDVDERTWHVVHVGVVCPAPLSAHELHDPPRILMAARLAPEKRHDLLLRAVAGLRDRGVVLDVQLAGGGELEHEVRRAIDDLGLAGSVRLLGFVEPTELLERYRAGDVDVVVLSSQIEGISVSLMEAMANGIPVVAFDVGAQRELLGNRAVPAGDVNAFATAIGEIVSGQAAWSTAAGEAVASVRRGFDVEKTTDELLALIGLPGIEP